MSKSSKTSSSKANTKLNLLMKKFNLIFDEKFMDYVDDELLHLGFIMFDIIKFDEFLHKKFGNYESKKKSMKDILLENYGDEACKFLEEIIDSNFIVKHLEQ